MEFSELMLRVGENIRRLRSAKGLSQVDLSAMTEIEQANLTHLEKGRTNPTLRTLYRIADALEVSIIDLISSVEQDK